MGKLLKRAAEWRDCPNMCSEVIFSRFVVFKTPFSKLGHRKGEAFTVSTVFDLAAEKGMKLGLWIDLTYSWRYYDPSEVQNRNCEYVKFPIEGNNRKVTEKQIRMFNNICSRFFHDCEDKLIAVHCTHGFNRTGFFIVSYMIEEIGWNAARAVAEFARLRPPGIYREDKINAISKKYNVKLITPPLPPWVKKA